MSVCYWIKIPDWKVLMFIGSMGSDANDMETFKERIEKLIESVKDFDNDIIEQKISDFSAKDMAKVVHIADQVWIVGEWGFMQMMLMYLLEKENVGFEVVYEGDIDDDKLKSEGWHIVRN
jgi:hypothetical protein